MRTALPLCASALLALATVRCGSGNATPVSDGGSASGGGQQDAGGGGGGGQPDAGGGGGGQPDAGGGGGGGGDQPDAGADGGIAQDECAGLGPDAVGPPNATVALSVGVYDDCEGSSTDGSGTVALMVANHSNGFQAPQPFAIHLFGPSGSSSGTYRDGIETILVEELAGFELRNSDFQQGELVSIDERGSVVATTGKINEYPRLVGNDPLGGIVVLFVVSGKTSLNTIAAYDDQLNLRWRTQLSTTAEVQALGTDRQGNSLVLFNNRGGLGGIWIDHSGAAGAEFQAADGIRASGSPEAQLLLSPRVGSGLFLAIICEATASCGINYRANWVRQFESMGAGSAAPDWLMARPNTRLHMARNGRAYAVIHSPSSEGGCHADIEVIATTGKVCGTAVFPGEPYAGFCVAGLTVGYDGTVIERLPHTFFNDGTSNYNCNYRWWTGFLR
jgi:hypothetical protein